MTYQIINGRALRPFFQKAGTDEMVDTRGDTIWAVDAFTMQRASWSKYQAEQAAAAATVTSYGYVAGGGGYAGQAATLSASGGGGGGYAGRGFVDVVFDDGLKFLHATQAPPRADVCTCGGQKFGGGTCSSWCDSSAARAQHAGGAS